MFVVCVVYIGFVLIDDYWLGFCGGKWVIGIYNINSKYLYIFIWMWNLKLFIIVFYGFYNNLW